MDQNDSSNRFPPTVPCVGVGAVILKGNQFLLIKRGQEPAKGAWTFPGGLVKLGETVREAVHREVTEECGIKIKLRDEFELIELIHDHDNNIFYHYIILDFFADYLEGDLTVRGDVDEAKWFKIQDLQTLNTTTATKQIVERALKVSD